MDEDDIQNIKPLPNLDYKIVQGNSLLGLPDGAFLDTDIKDNLEEKKKKYFYLTNPSAKQKMREEIENLFVLLVESAKQYSPSLGNINFDYHTHFSEVFQQSGGFDVVIGNPPYIGEKGNKKLFNEVKSGHLKQFYLGKMDYFYFFFHLALNLSKTNSQICFITTNYYLTAYGAKKLRTDIKKRAVINTLVNFNELKLFENATGQHNLITILTKSNNENISAFTCITKRSGIDKDEFLMDILLGRDSETQYYTVRQNYLYESEEYYIRIDGTQSALTTQNKNSVSAILAKIKSTNYVLGNICSVDAGLHPGVDRISEKYLINTRSCN